MIYVTAIYGGYDTPKPLTHGDGVLFTDDPDLDAPGWDVIVDRRYAHLHPRLQAKAPKLQPHVFHPEIPVSTWVDGSMTVHPPAGGLEPGPLRFFRHPQRDNVLDEAFVSQGMAKYAGLPVEAQARHYISLGIRPGLWASGFHIRDITTPDVRGFFDVWWRENLTWTYQDQLSLPWAAQETGIRIVDIPGNLWANPYFTLAPHTRDD